MSGVNARISALQDEVHDAVRLQCLKCSEAKGFSRLRTADGVNHGVPGNSVAIKLSSEGCFPEIYFDEGFTASTQVRLGLC